MEFIQRYFTPPKQSFFLFGPRGTGKSLWVKHVYPSAHRIDLLDPEAFRIYASRPERLGEIAGVHLGKRIIIIDEVQKAPGLLSMVHKLIEEERSIQFILTGSSARKLKRTGVDLLAGRAMLKTLHPFMAAELGIKFRLKKALEDGLLPLVWGAENPQQVLHAYLGLYLKEEVQTEGLVRRIGDFGRFLEAISFSHAAVLNTSNVARECQVGARTVQGYVEILQDLLLGFTLPVFTKRAKRETASHPKFYFFDAGVFRAIRPKGPLDQPTEMEGAALEGLVVQHLRAWIAYRAKKNDLYYWRTRSGVEVDVVLYGEDGFWAIEVKNSSKVYPHDIRSLVAFRQDYPQCNTLMLYRGAERLKINGVLCLPAEEFLKQLSPGSLLPTLTNR